MAQVYGWPADLPDEEILTRLVALNTERSKEEARGNVRWLRLDYQVPRFGSASEKAALADTQHGLDLCEAEVTPGAALRVAFPASDAEQTRAVMAALLAASRPLSPDALASDFKQGRKVRGKVASVLTSLARMGVIATTADGKSYQLYRG